MHTPWQMLAWGGVGVLGALAARALGERPARIPLAALCALAGLAFGAFMDLSVWATVGGTQHSLAEYGAISLRKPPFNIAHGRGQRRLRARVRAGRAGRARAGPRAHERHDPPAGGRRHRGGSAGPLSGPAALEGAVVLALSGVGALAAPTASQAAAKTPDDYLVAHQVSSGGFGEGDSAVALEPGGPRWRSGRRLGFPTPRAPKPRPTWQSTAKGSTDPGDLERTILGLRALGAPATDAHGPRPRRCALLSQQASDGSFAGW